MKQYSLASDRIKVMNYQEMEAHIIKGKLDKKPLLFVADECHYFFCDSTFNRTSDIVLEFLLHYSNSRVLYMSATPNLFLNYIKEYYPDYTLDWFRIRREEKLKASIYYYWTESVQKKIIQKIINETDDKILYFRDCIEKNNELEKQYGNIAVSICRSNRNKGRSKKEYLSITNHERIQDSTRIVLSTTVLNNGINIANDDIKHVFISDFYDLDDAVQCIGRKRISSHEHINIYVKIPTIHELKCKRKELEKTFGVVQDKEKLSVYEFTKKYARKTIEVIYINSTKDGDLSWEVNKVMAFKTLHQIKLIDAIIERGGKEYIKQLEKDLNYEIKTKRCIEPNTSDRLRDELTSILSKNAGKTLYSNRNTGKKSDIVSFMEEINTCKHLTEKFKVSDSPSPVKLKNMMSMLGVSYTIETKSEKASKNGHLYETKWIIKEI